MADRLRLALVFHQHQPAGNFPHVFADVAERAYAPLVAALYRHPEVKATLHFSGPLLDWLEGNRPDVIGDLADLVRRGQIELLSGGYYEPILVGVPRRDAVGQIRALTDRVAAIFGRRPLGAWLTERVWEPHLPSVLAEAGVAYTILDEEHFLQGGLRRDELGESFITEDQGFPLVLYPANTRLRYLIPFRDVGQTMKELRERQAGGARLVVYADDGEKFGAWPGTYQRVHKDGWLEDFFTQIAQADFIETTTLEDAWIFQKPERRVYLPGGTYHEMGDWSLDAGAARRFAQARNALKEDLASLVALPPWRNFLSKYPEANALHKRMLIVSEELARRSILDASPEVRQAQQNLWRAQTNDVYWHGVFGGLYLPHLRADAYGALLRAGKASDKDSKSIHEIVRAKERGLVKLLEYDDARRAFFQDSFRVGREDPVSLRAFTYQLTPQREARTVSLILEPPARALASLPGLGVRKDIRIADEGLAAGVRYRLRNDGEDSITLTFTSASNVAFVGEANVGDLITLGTRKTTPGKTLENARNISEIAVHSEARHFDITFAVDPPAETSVRPIYAIANSEEGFERLYEQTEISCSWTVTIEADSHVDLEIRATALGQLVEPELIKPAARRKRTVAAPAGGDAVARPKR